jgi:hypothetical protein
VRVSGSARGFCRRTRRGRRRRPMCSRSCICGGSRPGTSARRCAICSGRTPRGCLRTRDPQRPPRSAQQPGPANQLPRPTASTHQTPLIALVYLWTALIPLDSRRDPRKPTCPALPAGSYAEFRITPLVIEARLSRYADPSKVGATHTPARPAIGRRAGRHNFQQRGGAAASRCGGKRRPIMPTVSCTEAGKTLAAGRIVGITGRSA